MKSAELESLFVLADRANDLARDAERWERDGSEDGRNLERLKQHRVERAARHRGEHTMKVQVTLLVDVDADEYQAEYHLNSAAEALVAVLKELRQPEQYLSGAAWEGLAKVEKATATILL